MRTLAVTLTCLLAATAASAADYRAVGVPVAVLYDAPSAKARKLYLVRASTPLEVVVKLDGWKKVRDAEGSLAWIEAAQLAEQRTLIVTAAQAELRSAAQPEAPVVATLAKWVLVDWVAVAAPGWVQVRHRDGATGFMRANQVWGL